MAVTTDPYSHIPTDTERTLTAYATNHDGVAITGSEDLTATERMNIEAEAERAGIDLDKHPSKMNYNTKLGTVTLKNEKVVDFDPNPSLIEE